MELKVGDRVAFQKSFLNKNSIPCNGPFGQARGTVESVEGEKATIVWEGPNAGFFHKTLHHTSLRKV